MRLQKILLLIIVIALENILASCRTTLPNLSVPSVHIPASELEPGKLDTYTIAYCWRQTDALASVDFPEQQEIYVVVSDGSGSRKSATDQYPSFSAAFVNMLGCLSEDRQSMRLESNKLSWRPNSEDLTIVYGTNPALTNFKSLSISDSLLIDDNGDPVGQNNYFINPKRVFWAPDGTKLATLATDTELDSGLGSNIWVYDMITGEFSRISNIERVGNFIANASWSSNGDRIAVGYGVPFSGIAISAYGNQQSFVEITSDTQDELNDWPYVVDSLFEVFSKDSIYAFGLSLPSNSLPVWVNNDSQIVFVAADDNQEASLFIVNSDGTSLNELLPELTGNVALPTLAPDESTLAFIRYPTWKDRKRVEIATLDLITMDYKSLVVLPAPDNGDELLISGLSWTPDSQYLAFSSPHAGESDIWVITRDGNSWVNITKDVDGDAVSPAWKP